MTADPPGSPAAEGVRSLEVRWIFPGQLETAVAGWFGRFPDWDVSFADPGPGCRSPGIGSYDEDGCKPGDWPMVLAAATV